MHIQPAARPLTAAAIAETLAATVVFTFPGVPTWGLVALVIIAFFIALASLPISPAKLAALTRPSASRDIPPHQLLRDMSGKLYGIWIKTREEALDQGLIRSILDRARRRGEAIGDQDYAAFTGIGSKMIPNPDESIGGMLLLIDFPDNVLSGLYPGDVTPSGG